MATKINKDIDSLFNKYSEPTRSTVLNERIDYLKTLKLLLNNAQKINDASSKPRKLEFNKELKEIYQKIAMIISFNSHSKDLKKELKLNNNVFNSDCGILILGNTGGGKTFLMNAIASLRHIKEYKLSGLPTSPQKIINKYRNDIPSYERLKDQNNIFIDDLGCEPDMINNYGTKESVVGDFIKNFFDEIEYSPNFKRLFITSNLKMSEIKEKYGDRILSRIKGNMNIIVLPENDYRTI